MFTGISPPLRTEREKTEKKKTEKNRKRKKLKKYQKKTYRKQNDSLNARTKKCLEEPEETDWGKELYREIAETWNDLDVYCGKLARKLRKSCVENKKNEKRRLEESAAAHGVWEGYPP